MYFQRFFQTDVLIKFFIPLRPNQAISCENVILEKLEPGSTKKRGSRVPEMKFTCNSKM